MRARSIAPPASWRHCAPTLARGRLASYSLGNLVTFQAQIPTFNISSTFANAGSDCLAGDVCMMRRCSRRGCSRGHKVNRQSSGITRCCEGRTCIKRASQAARPRQRRSCICISTIHMTKPLYRVCTFLQVSSL